MTTYRIQMEFPYFTLLPKDVSVNTFHVTCLPGLSDVELGDVLNRFINFYNTGHGGSNALATFMHPSLSRGANVCTATAYDLADPEPRPPKVSTNFTLGAASGTGGVALETAVCLSMHGSFPAGEVRARRRGRIFFGPISTSGIGAGTSSTFPVVNGNLLLALTRSAEWLVAEIPAVNALAFWSVWSRVNNEPVEIIGGWVDDALDTQRRRGQDPVGRSLWSA